MIDDSERIARLKALLIGCKLKFEPTVEEPMGGRVHCYGCKLEIPRGVLAYVTSDDLTKENRDKPLCLKCNKDLFTMHDRLWHRAQEVAKQTKLEAQKEKERKSVHAEWKNFQAQLAKFKRKHPVQYEAFLEQLKKENPGLFS